MQGVAQLITVTTAAVCVVVAPLQGVLEKHDSTTAFLNDGENEQLLRGFPTFLLRGRASVWVPFGHVALPITIQEGKENACDFGSYAAHYVLNSSKDSSASEEVRVAVVSAVRSSLAKKIKPLTNLRQEILQWAQEMGTKGEGERVHA